ncbi:MAG: efflux RND transporter periplasmic adaptor subunit [Salaquimonas sp.]|nr:efflux RND transporter periplasmic adaptor subunit [Salaquimonas sp.]
MKASWKLAAVGLALILAGCNEEKAPQKAEIRPVRTTIVELKPIENDNSAVGEVAPRYESDLGFRVSGKLISRPVDVGDTVKKGDLLAKLEEQDFSNRLRSAKADVDSAEAVLTEAKNAEERQKQLLTNGTTTRANYDAAFKNLNAAQAQLEAAKANYQLASDQLEYTELKADFDGIVTGVGAENGQIVSAGQMVVKLARPEVKEAIFSIPEAAFVNLPKDLPEVVISLLSDTKISTTGTIREVSPVADPATRTYKAKVTLNDPPPQMRFGSSVVGHLRSRSEPVIVLPGSALFDEEGKPAVWRFDAASGTVSLVPVTVDRYETDRVILSSGLEKGDIVVTAGVNRLREGQHVRLDEGAAK